MASIPEELHDIFPKQPPMSYEEAASIVSGKDPFLQRQDRWPDAMKSAAFDGLAGDFVKLVLPETEADPHALLVTFLVGIGCILGRTAFYQVEATRHHVNLFGVLTLPSECVSHN